MRSHLFATVRAVTLFALLSAVAGCGVPIVGAGVDDAGNDAYLCRPGESLCGLECVLLQTDSVNCGACGTTCVAGDVCVEGACVTECPPGQLECAGDCRDPRADREHCGACGLACMAGQVCSAGECASTCATGLDNCDGSCRDFQTDRLHCGACGLTCASGEVCSMGACAVTCADSLMECDGVCRDLQSDRRNCGTCGTMCLPGSVCSTGTCELSCGGGLSDCDGVCRDLTNDRANCGACGTTCADGQVCSEGACALSCDAALMQCDGVCRDLQTDRNHCGACGTMCSAGEVCSAGSCEVSCGGGLANCGGVCRDTQSDLSNCGMCGTACVGGQVCTEGACTISCGAGLNACTGVCRDFQTDRNNCGVCGNACAAGQICNAGTCELSCLAPQQICGSACVDTSSDRANCGMCGNACGVGRVCSMGMCQLSCGSGLLECSGDCVNTRFDPSNCGACGTTCGPYANALASCSDRCIMTCDSGFADCDGSTVTGCEAQLATSTSHCGRCGNACTFANAAAMCTAGTCGMGTCNVGFADCDGRASNGCECRVLVVGPTGAPPFSGGTIRDLDEDPATGAITPSGMVTTTSRDYLWVVNVAESTVSKWDATMRIEIGRYRVGLPAGECAGRCCHESGCNMPSRVVVDGNGDAYIANRAFSFQGTVVKIAGDRADCVDRNGNGMIDTSSSATPLGWNADECVLWTANVGSSNAVLRAITVDRGDATRPNGYIWVGAYNTSQFFRLDPQSGAVLNTISMGIQPYGAVVLGDGRLWATNLGSSIQPIDTTTRVLGAVVNLPFSIYGPTADAVGRLWFVYPGGNYIGGYNPATGQSTRVTLRSGTSSGVTSDALGNIWTGLNEGTGRASLARIPSSSFVGGAPGTIPTTAITYFDGPANPTGAPATAVGVDRSGAVWLASNGGNSRLLRLDPMTGIYTEHLGPNRTYSYSDFTGSVRRASIPQGSYEQTFDLGCANPTLMNFELAGSFPMDTSTTVSMRTASTAGALGAATPVAIASLPPLASPYALGPLFSTAGVTPAQHLRVTIVLRASSGGAVPSASRIGLVWTCP